MRVRKQVYDLKQEDLVEHPVWEFALDEEGEDEQDEATVRPVSVNGPVDCSNRMVVVMAEFSLPDGSVMVGCLRPPSTDIPFLLKFEGDSSLSKTQPVIITDRGQVLFWYGIAKPDEATVQRNYEMIGRADGVFPISYRSTVELSSGLVAGEITGFTFLEERKCGLFRKKKLCVAVIQ
jgi:hypothetical protein